MTVGSMEAAVECTGMYSQRVIKNFSLFQINIPSSCVGVVYLIWLSGRTYLPR